MVWAFGHPPRKLSLNRPALGRPCPFRSDEYRDKRGAAADTYPNRTPANSPDLLVLRPIKVSGAATARNFLLTCSRMATKDELAGVSYVANPTLRVRRPQRWSRARTPSGARRCARVCKRNPAQGEQTCPISTNSTYVQAARLPRSSKRAPSRPIAPLPFRLRARALSRGALLTPERGKRETQSDSNADAIPRSHSPDQRGARVHRPYPLHALSEDRGRHLSHGYPHQLPLHWMARIHHCRVAGEPDGI